MKNNGNGLFPSAVKRPGRGQVGEFPGSAGPAQNGVTVREAAKPLDQRVVMTGEGQALLQARLLVEPHRALLIGQRLAVHER